MPLNITASHSAVFGIIFAVHVALLMYQICWLPNLGKNRVSRLQQDVRQKRHEGHRTNRKSEPSPDNVSLPAPPYYLSSAMDFATATHVEKRNCRLNVDKILLAAFKALHTGDVSDIRLHDCLYIRNESVLEKYEEGMLFQKWAENDNLGRESLKPGAHLVDVTPPSRIIYATYAEGCCEKGKARALEAAKNFGFTSTFAYNASAMTEAFRKKYQHVLRSKRGAGYWMWKPYVILKTLLIEAGWGDYVCYADADASVISDPRDIVRFATQQPYGIFLPHTPHYNYGFGFTEGKLQKRDNLILLNMDTEQVRRTVPFQANHIFLPKTIYTIQLVSEWLKYAVDARSVTDQPNELGLPNYPEFYDHRHDQAILSLLAKKWGLAMWRDATQYGEQELERGKFDRIASGPYNQVFQYWSPEV